MYLQQDQILCLVMTFAVMSPEHKLINKILSLSPNSQEIQSYIDVAKSKSEFRENVNNKGKNWCKYWFKSHKPNKQ